MTSRYVLADEQLPWYALHVRSRSEFLAHTELTQRGFEAFLPLLQRRRRWSDRVKLIQMPLFPGYLFCRFEPADRLRILNAAGVARVVGVGPVPAPVSALEIESIRRLVESKVMLVPCPFLREGQRVQVERGPLAGVEGVVVRAEDGKPRVVVSVTLLQRSIAAEIEREWISA